MPEFIDYKEVFITSDFSKMTVIESILDAEGIIYFVQEENFAYMGYGAVVTPLRLMVKKDEVEKAKEVLKDFF
jgi:hypothetical protein